MFKIVNKIEKSYDNNVVFFFEGEFETCGCIPESDKKLIEKLAEKKEFTGKKGEVLTTDFLMNEQLISMSFVGFGQEKDFTNDIYREVVFNFLKDRKGSILISSPKEILANKDILCEIVGNVNYSFDSFKLKKDDKIDVELFMNEVVSYEEAIALSEATDIARELVDLPANIINPQSLSEKVKSYGDKFGFEVEILDEKEIEKLGMNLFSAVGRASVNKPRLIVMRYHGDKEEYRKVGLVGKGLTYDTGGLCVKPADSMLNMKDDMAGAAAVIGAMCAIAKNKIKKNVIAMVGACENAINGNSYRPGDIIKSMNGKHVEIINTDAEGRLVLADVLTYAVRNEKVSEIIDIATLTGAMLVSLGTITTGVFSNDDENYTKLEAASKEHGEKVWRLPLFSEYEEGLKSTVADVKHTGGRMGGSITAAKFLEGFVEGTPWIHMDIAGTSFDNSAKWLKKGASGVGVKALYTYCKL